MTLTGHTAETQPAAGGTPRFRLRTADSISASDRPSSKASSNALVAEQFCVGGGLPVLRIEQPQLPGHLEARGDGTIDATIRKDQAHATRNVHPQTYWPWA